MRHPSKKYCAALSATKDRAYPDCSIFKRRGYETAVGFEQSSGMATYVPVF